MRCVAIIPARGGSKGIPRKNLQSIGHETLLQRTIRHALQSQEISDVYVSTEDDEIEERAQHYGAKVIKRPAALAGDSSSTEEAIEHALGYIDADILILLQCTSPFRSPGQLDEALNSFNPFTNDSMVSVVPFHGFLWGVPGDNWVKLYHERRMRQDMDQEYFLETGSFYIFTRDCFDEHKNRIGASPTCFVVPQHDSMEIDSEFDLEKARALVRFVPECAI